MLRTSSPAASAPYHTRALQGRQRWGAMGLAALILALRVGPWTLENDQYRLYLTAWRMAEGLPDATAGYVLRTSYLYLQGSIAAIRAGFSFNDWALASSAAGAIAVFVVALALNQIDRWRRPFWVVALVLLLPGLNLLSYYGFPTVLAVALLLAIVFVPGRWGGWGAPLECALFLAALLLKADVVLIFPGLVLFFAWFDGEARRFMRLCAAGFAALGAQWLIQQQLGSTTEFAASWTDAYPFTIKALWHKYNAANVVAAGLGLTGLGAIYFYRELRAKRLFPALFLLLWAALPALFWGLIIGNSVRHLVPATLAIALAAIYFTQDWPPKRRWYLLLIILGVNLLAPPYWRFGPAFVNGAYIWDAAKAQAKHEQIERDAKLLVQSDARVINYLTFYQKPMVEKAILDLDPRVQWHAGGWRLTNGTQVNIFYLPDLEAAMPQLMQVPAGAGTLWVSDQFTQEQVRGRLQPVKTLH